MIIESIFNAIKYVILSIISYLPSITLAQVQDLITGLSSFKNLLSLVDCFMPLTTLFICLQIICGLFLIEFVISIVNWAARKFPGVD